MNIATKMASCWLALILALALAAHASSFTGYRDPQCRTLLFNATAMSNGTCMIVPLIPSAMSTSTIMFEALKPGCVGRVFPRYDSLNKNTNSCTGDGEVIVPGTCFELSKWMYYAITNCYMPQNDYSEQWTYLPPGLGPIIGRAPDPSSTIPPYISTTSGYMSTTYSNSSNFASSTGTSSSSSSSNSNSHGEVSSLDGVGLIGPIFGMVLGPLAFIGLVFAGCRSYRRKTARLEKEFEAERRRRGARTTASSRLPPGVAEDATAEPPPPPPPPPYQREGDAVAEDLEHGSREPPPPEYGPGPGHEQQRPLSSERRNLPGAAA